MLRDLVPRDAVIAIAESLPRMATMDTYDQ
jgi:hypothetical protein